MQLVACDHKIRTCSVNLEWNSLGQQPEALSTFLVAISESTSVKSLDLRNTSLGRECGAAVGNLIARNRSIQHLDLRWNSLGSDAEQHILTGLQQNPVIRTIELAGNELSPECLSAAGACPSCRALQRAMHCACFPQKEYASETESLPMVSTCLPSIQMRKLSCV